MARVRDVAAHEPPEDLAAIHQRCASEDGPFANRVAVIARLRAAFPQARIGERALRVTLCGVFHRFNEALGIAAEPEVAA